MFYFLNLSGVFFGIHWPAGQCSALAMGPLWGQDPSDDIPNALHVTEGSRGTVPLVMGWV